MPRRLVMVLGALLIVGCSLLDSPLGNVVDEGKIYTVLSGDDGAPVVGALVRVGNDSLITNELGEFAVPAGVRSTSIIAIEKENSLTRETLLGNLGVHTVMPMRYGATPDFIEELIGRTSRRPLARVISLVPSEEIASGQHFASVYQTVVDEMNAKMFESAHIFSLVHSPLITFKLATNDIAEGLVVRLYISSHSGIPEGKAAAAHLRTDSYGTIVGASIVFTEMRWAQSPAVIMHELGHVLGLRHSSYGGMMTPDGRGEQPSVWTDRDELALRLLLQRLPGNRFPDSDVYTLIRILNGASETEEVFTCEF